MPRYLDGIPKGFWQRVKRYCEDLPFPLAHLSDKKVKRFHFSEIIGRLPYMRATVTGIPCR
jgi:hypothetical protein